MFKWFKPAPHIDRLDDAKTDETYKRLRLQVFLGIFIGYAGYYLLRKNFAFAIPYLQEEGFTKSELGFVLAAVSIAYGFSKFIMGMISDRCNPRYFLAGWTFSISSYQYSICLISMGDIQCMDHVFIHVLKRSGFKEWGGRHADERWHIGFR